MQKISIIIPIYNVGQYLHKCLDSILSQTYNDFEVILVDDGSNDDSGVICDEYAQRDSRIKVTHKENGGVSSARNVGLELSSGEYIVFFDGDDYISDNLFESIISHLNVKDFDVLFWRYNSVRENGTVVENLKTLEANSIEMTGIEVLKEILLNGTLRIWIGSIAYKKSFLKKYQFEYSPGCCNGEDQEFTYKVLSRADSVLFANEILSFYLQRENSATHSSNINRFDAVSAVKRAYEYIDNLNDRNFEQIKFALRYQKIVSDYLYNLSSCLMSSNKLSIWNLLNKIEIYYPGLNEEINAIRKSYKGDYKKFPLGMRVFFISPIVYFILSDIKVFITKNQSNIK